MRCVFSLTAATFFAACGPSAQQIEDKGDRDVTSDRSRPDECSLRSIVLARDFNDDGVYDFVDVFDADHAPISSRADYDADGQDDVRSDWTYDDEGRLLSQTSDTDGDGAVDVVITHTYTADGRSLSSTVTDGLGVLQQATRWTYDDSGWLLSRAEDVDGDGQIDGLETWEYDEAGRLIAASRVNSATDQLLWQERRSYDEGGRLSLYELDEYGDGFFEYRESATYTAWGAPQTDVILSYWDDGTLASEQSLTNFYHAQGYLISTTTYSLNSYGAVRCSVKTYRRDGSMASNEVDLSCDEVLDAYGTYNEQGEPLFWHEDIDGDGAFEVVETWRRDDAGRVIEHLLDQNRDGEVEYCDRFSFDEDGRMLLRESGCSSEDPWASSERFTYDSAGRLVLREFDLDADGQFDQIERWGYDLQDRLVLWEKDEDGDGTADWYLRESFDVQGVVLTREKKWRQNEWSCERPLDGHIFTCETRVDGERTEISRSFISERGNWYRTETDYDLDGYYEDVTSYGFDCR